MGLTVNHRTCHELRIAFAATFAVVTLSLFGWTTALERPVWDLLMRIPRLQGAPDSGMAAVVVDNPSIASYGPLPWPRTRLAQVIQRIRTAGARAVVVDILLPDTSDLNGNSELARAFAAGPVAAAAVLAPDGTWIMPADDLGGLDIAAHAHAEVESDGVLRMVSSTKQANGVSLPALSVAAARFAGWQGAVKPGALLRPDFRTPPASIPMVSAADVILGRDTTTLLRSRIVFFGVSASGAGDQFLVPVGDRHRPVAGVLVHASVASSIFRDGLLRELPWWGVFALCFLTALTMQVSRSRAGSLRLMSLAVAVVTIPLVALVSLWVFDLLMPAIGLLATAGVSVFLREVLESRGAQRQTDAIVKSLVDLELTKPASAIPRGVQGRLQYALLLQEQLIRDRELRRTLLEGLEEGVVLWGEDGAPLLHNAATQRLWGHVPSQSEVAPQRAGQNGDSSATLEVDRDGRTIEVSHRDVGTRSLALIRDTSAQHELERRRREMQRLVSHELKTPLASIAGLGEMLERYPLTGEELARTAGMIRSEAERLGLMVKRFLDLERLGSDHKEQQRTELDLSALVGRRCEVLAASAELSNIGIVVHAAHPVLLAGVPQLLEELVDNLVGNALKYSIEDSQVVVEVRSIEDTAVLEIIDHGQGIPEEAIVHLFERFYRVPGVSAPGTGLGLALVKEVAALHRASIAVESELGRGSTFTVTFPRSEA